MWPFSSYPERSPSDVQHQTYDYIIVGGGTAGCVVASRLSEDLDCSVLIIDKGHAKDDIVSHIPLMSQNMSLDHRMQLQGNLWSEPVLSAKERRNQLWGVEGLGGASRVNGMIWTRGFPGDYAAWSEMGLQDWAYEKLESYFRVTQVADHSLRVKGLLSYGDSWSPFVWTGHLRNAAHELGLPLGHDVNNPDAPSMGFFDLDTAIDAHRNRISAFSSYLSKSKALQRRDRLTICTGAIATRLETAVEAGIVTGVHITPCKAPLCDILVKARREVIICSGALCTPQLLMLSGIGPGESSRNWEYLSSRSCQQ
ncbi:Glucose-methanol-choline oxidoreductase [Moelleriella libera RCEF 2490]|uniref:Glucose-methanol-choline oxidoreductase n=1 Tax=Moelleriella libera RCEF 2490 TaxID=1081109 RepID=A0A162I448_9HYPO|nr:Glucose-methanol-choline oxidoreductase [Moelleriella libera RCEF 2490]